MKIIEILIAVLVLALAIRQVAGFFTKKKSSGCADCSTDCPMRGQPDHCGDITFIDKKPPLK